MELGMVVRANELIPIETTVSGTSKLAKILSSIPRSKVKDKALVCTLISPDGTTGVFLDNSGKEYLIDTKALESDITYVNAKYVRKTIPKYIKQKRSTDEFDNVIRTFLDRHDNARRYSGWSGFSSDDQSITVPAVNEENRMGSSKYQSGRVYRSKDGQWKFKVLAVTSNYVKILDYTDNKKYKVEISDLELANPVVLNDEVNSTAIATKVDQGKEIVNEEQTKPLSWREVNAGIRKAEASFVKKMNDFADNYESGFRDAAVNLKKYGRDWTDENDLDRTFVEDAQKVAKKLLAYYNKSIKPRVESFIKDKGNGWNFTDKDSDDMPDDYKQLLVDLEDLQWVIDFDVDKDDLSQLKHRF